MYITEEQKKRLRRVNRYNMVNCGDFKVNLKYKVSNISDSLKEKEMNRIWKEGTDRFHESLGVIDVLCLELRRVYGNEWDAENDSPVKEHNRLPALLNLIEWSVTEDPNSLMTPYSQVKYKTYVMYLKMYLNCLHVTKECYQGRKDEDYMFMKVMNEELQEELQLVERSNEYYVKEIQTLKIQLAQKNTPTESTVEVV